METRARGRAAIGVTWVLVLAGSVGAALADGGARSPADLTSRTALAEEGPRGWESVGPEGGRIEAFVQCPSNPQRMYALPYRLGLYRSDDRGESWSRVVGDLPLDGLYWGLAVSPVDDEVLLLTHAEGRSHDVLRSADGGRTWSRYEMTGVWWGEGVQLRFDPHDADHVLLSGAWYDGDECGQWELSGGVFLQSTDGGRSWSQVTVPGWVTDIEFHPGTPGTVFAGADDGLYRSTDGGETWSRPNMPSIESVSLSFCRDVPSRAWAIGVDELGLWPWLLRSDDGGATFWAVDVPPGCPSCRFRGVVAHPADPDRVLLVREPGTTLGTTLFESLDGGWTWGPELTSSLFDGPRISALAYDLERPDGVYMALSNYFGYSWIPRPMARNGLVRSDDGGKSWATSMGGIHGLSIAGLGDDASGTLWAWAGGEDGLHRTESPRDAWTAVGSWSSGWGRPSAFYVDDRASGVLHAVTGYLPCPPGVSSPAHVRSPDGGSSWLETWFGALPWPWHEDQAVFPELVVTGGQWNPYYVWFHDDWSNRGLLRVGLGHECHATEFLPAGAAMDPDDGLRMFAVDSESPGTVQLTTDGGATWEPTRGQPGAAADRGVDLFMDPEDSDRLAVVYETSGVWETTNAGKNWRRIPTGTGPSAVAAADWDPRTDRVFLAMKSGAVWVTGLRWTGSELPTRDLTDIDFVPGRNALLLGTAHAGAFLLELPDAQGGESASYLDSGALSSGPGAGAVDTELRLTGIAPNPFAETATIRYALPRASGARIGIYDVTGRLVSSLRDAATDAGPHTVVWNGRDGSGARVAAGTYFVRLDTGHQARTAKVVYLGGN